MRSPAAWIPSRRASADLLKLARQLRLVPSDPGEASVANLPDGRQAIQLPVSESSTFLASISDDVLTVPPMIVDFHIWQYVPPSTLSIPLSGVRWLRMTIEVECDNTLPLGELDGTYPVHATVGTPSLAIYDPDPDGTIGYEAGVPSFAARDYYFYILEITDGVITQNLGFPGYARPLIFH